IEEKNRIINLLERYNIDDISVILSGDVHFNVVNKKNRIYEFTVSSLTHSIDLFSFFLAVKKSNFYAKKFSQISLHNSWGFLEFHINDKKTSFKDKDKLKDETTNQNKFIQQHHNIDIQETKSNRLLDDIKYNNNDELNTNPDE